MHVSLATKGLLCMQPKCYLKARLAILEGHHNAAAWPFTIRLHSCVSLDTCSSAIVLQHHQHQLQSYHGDVIHPSKPVTRPSLPG